MGRCGPLLPVRCGDRDPGQGLPLILVYDLVATLERNAGLGIDRKLLRCSTFGRGVYECDLSPAPRPPVHLYLRHAPVDDGFRRGGRVPPCVKRGLTR